MRKIVPALVLTAALFLSMLHLSAQDKWDLRRCVDYAVANNINIKQTDIQAKIAALTLEQSKLQNWPTANFTNSYGFQFGRSIDPTSNGFINQQISSSKLGVTSNVTLFNFFSLKNTIAVNEFELKAQNAGVQKLRDDISLSVAVAYLQALLSKEQMNISVVQLNQTKEQLTNTQKLVDAGSLPELNAAELEAQLARDSSSYITALTTYYGNLLSLKVWMNLDPALPFELETPPVDMIPIEAFAELQPDFVYKLALQNMPIQKVNQFRLESLEKFQKASRAKMYPSIRAFGQLNSSFSSYQQQLAGYSAPSVKPIGYTGTGSATNYNVFTQVQVPIYENVGFFQQMNNNFNQSIGVSLNVPIFNNGQAKTAWQRSKLNYQNQQLQVDRDNQTLKQDIYKAYNDATAAFQRYQASIKSVSTAEYSYELTKKRYEAGLLRTIDLITNQSNLFRARLEKISNQFDYVFRMKLLEFYKGQGLKL